MTTFAQVTGRLDDRTAGNLYSVVVAVVIGGGAIGWVGPPSRAEFDEWLDDVVAAAQAGDAVAVLAGAAGGAIAGFGYWRRYARPTLRVNADLEKVFVAPADRGTGIGGRLVSLLAESARQAGIETLTLDVRGDNIGALRLYERLGFTEYGRRTGFVAVGPYRYDQVLLSLKL
ncbi:GNAT family N-acetyltransferase [Cryptosporangium aurantiacum]|uniref:L-amino acid N-acyltransferase YncA n=1 Tax=Cryptosporangium aurantiacum TaxID=134849 RepID=A0A1M7RKQ9_9ACTN|nr:GNAT family N-acetyltransferase [Cryptosporangium aurantiacum]SHN46854.1 L-amino acid N-acyltransferase YncA [Cryptosporangium aurantiacum]